MDSDMEDEEDKVVEDLCWKKADRLEEEYKMNDRRKAQKLQVKLNCERKRTTRRGSLSQTGSGAESASSAVFGERILHGNMRLIEQQLRFACSRAAAALLERKFARR